MPAKGPEYLGGGVYAQWADYDESLLLTTGSHIFAEADMKIYLDPPTLQALLLYVKASKEALQAQERQNDI